MKKKNITIDDLAIMVNKGFQAVDKRFDDVDKRFDRVEKRLDGVEKRLDGVEKRLDHVEENLLHLNAQVNLMEHDIQDIRGDMVRRHEFEDLMSRVKYMERKMGIESGK